MSFHVLGEPTLAPNGGLRSYEVFQRERVKDQTGAFPPRLLLSRQYLEEPHSVVGVLREQFSCYRDWVGNSFWVTRYDDVTSVFADDCNYETRSRRWHMTGDMDASDLPGRDLRNEIAYQAAWTQRVDALAADLFDRTLREARQASNGTLDLVVDVFLPFWLQLVAAVFGIPELSWRRFGVAWVRLQRGTDPGPDSTVAGIAAYRDLVSLLEPILAARREHPETDVVSAVAGLHPGDRPVTAADLAITLLEEDGQTLPGILSNLWCLLLGHPDQLAEVAEDRTRLRAAYYEAMRHSPPVVSARRFTRHEVERFGRLLPEGALVMCSAAAANRDPRVFEDPDRFSINRKDLCQREPRGQYRADGLASGISFGSGRPSLYPAVPEDRPRSRYALTRDVVVRVSDLLLESLPGLMASQVGEAGMRSQRIGGPYMCWSLPLDLSRRPLPA